MKTSSKTAAVIMVVVIVAIIAIGAYLIWRGQSKRSLGTTPPPSGGGGGALSFALPQLGLAPTPSTNSVSAGSGLTGRARALNAAAATQAAAGAVTTSGFSLSTP